MEVAEADDARDAGRDEGADRESEIVGRDDDAELGGMDEAAFVGGRRSVNWEIADGELVGEVGFESALLLVVREARLVSAVVDGNLVASKLSAKVSAVLQFRLKNIEVRASDRRRLAAC